MKKLTIALAILIVTSGSAAFAAKKFEAGQPVICEVTSESFNDKLNRTETHKFIARNFINENVESANSNPG